MFKIDETLRDAILSAMATEMNGGVIKIYDDTAGIPASADDSVGTAVLLCTISNNGQGTGISFDTTPVNGLIVKAPAETWKGSIVASGTAAFYRFCEIADDNSATSTASRMQGKVGLPGTDADLWFSSVDFVSGNEKEVNYYSVGMPESA